MARISISEAENYKSSGGGADYFSLKDDGDTADVRFLWDDVDDISLEVVHEIEEGGKKRCVSCLRKAGDPKDECPLCAAGERQQIKMFIPLYNEKEGKVQVWKRGRNFASKLSGLFNRYAPMSSRVVTIERHGKKGDTGTDYMMYAADRDGKTKADLPEAPDLSNSMCLEKTYQELDNFVKTGKFEGDTEISPRRPKF